MGRTELDDQRNAGSGCGAVVTKCGERRGEGDGKSVNEVNLKKLVRHNKDNIKDLKMYHRHQLRHAKAEQSAGAKVFLGLGLAAENTGRRGSGERLTQTVE